MYPLGKQFEVDYTRASSDDSAIIKGNNFRISVITERIVRLEYSPSGKFIDKPTQLVSRRNLGLANFSVDQNGSYINVSTKYFKLRYLKDAPFIGTKVDPAKNLKITLISRERDRNKDWYYKHPEARNMLGNMISVDLNAERDYCKGLYSLDGFASIDDSQSKLIMGDGTLVDPPADHVDIYVFMYDRDFKQALFDYFKLTGSPMLIPRYAFGNWWSRNKTYDDKETKNLIRHFEKKKIPLSVVLFDHDWHIRNIGEYKALKNGYTFNKELFKDPKKMIDRFHSKGIRVGLCIDPEGGFYPHEENYKYAKDFFKLNDPVVISFDPLNPKVLDVMFKIFLHPLESLGIDFFWNDYKGEKDINKLWITNHYMYLCMIEILNKLYLIILN